MHRTFLALGCFALLALAAPAAAADNGGGAVGGKCTATSANGTKITGVYTNDVDGLNCAGAAGSVNCKNSDGTDSGKCKAALTVHRPTNTMMAPATHPTGSTY